MSNEIDVFGPLVGAAVTLAAQWSERTDAHSQRLRALLGVSVRYVSPPKLEPTPPLRITAKVKSEFYTQPLDVTLSLRGDALDTRCSCGSKSECIHPSVVIVDLGSCPLLRDRLDGVSSAALNDAIAEGRKQWIARGQEARALAAWLAASTPIAAAHTPVTLVLATKAEHSARALSLSVLTSGPGRTSRALSTNDLNELSIAPQVRAVIDACFVESTRHKSFWVPQDRGAPVIDALADVGAVSEDARPLKRADTMATVALAVEHHTAVRDLRGRRGEKPIVEEQDRIVARWTRADTGEVIPDAVLFWGLHPILLSRQSMTLFAIDPRLDRALMKRAHENNAMVIPKDADRVALFRSLRKVARGGGARLCAPEALGLPAKETPAFALAIEGRALDLRVSLVAKYASDSFTLTGALAGELEEQAYSDTRRDLEAERGAREALRARGLEADADGVISLQGDAAAKFWLETLAELERAMAGVTIEVPAALRGARTKRSLTSRARVTFANDWFSVDPRFATEDDSVEVDFELLRAVIQGRRRWVALHDGTLAEITDAVRDDVTELLTVLGDHGARRLPRSALGAIERLADRPGVTLDEATTALRDRWRAVSVAPAPRVPDGLEATLRPYQRTGLAWLQFLDALGCGGVLADDMGLGKTLTTIAWLLERKQRDGAKPSLVIAPASVLGNWTRECARFAPSLRCAVLHGPSRYAVLDDPADYDVLVTSYALLRMDIEELSELKLRAVIFDEAQFVKNAQSESASCARRIQSDARLALTGTPVENHLGELWAIVDLVLPGMLGGAVGFDRRYAKPIATGDESAAERLRALTRPFVLRRTKKEVLTDLPPKEEIDKIVPMTKRQRLLYDRVAETLRQDVAVAVKTKGIERAAFNVLTALLRLRQLACDPRLVNEKLRSKDSGKRDAFLELARELRDEGRRALVFSQFVSLLELWKRDLDREGIAYEYLDGSTVDRDARVTRFQEGTAPLFLISLKAGGTGLNLTAADTVIHLDPWWNPAVEEQATDRAHRMGQSRKVTVYRLVSEGSVEEKITALKARKRALADAVVRETEGGLRGLTEDDIALLLSEAGAGDDDESDDERDDEERDVRAKAATSAKGAKDNRRRGRAR
jgi:superfamily II DNA or RNA helicase